MSERMNIVELLRDTATRLSRFNGPSELDPYLTADEMDSAADLIERLTAERDAALARAEAAEQQIYVPGLWRCAKCNFELLQSNLNAADGTVTPRDTPGEKCPNCDSPLWRVTERQRHHAIYEDAVQFMREARTAERERDAALARLLEANPRAIGARPSRE